MKNLSLKKVLLEEEDLSPKEKPSEEDSVDLQILRAILDAERSAVKSGKSQMAMSAYESLGECSLGFLFEIKDSVPPIDIGTFAVEIMRVIKNFDTLLDIPAVIINKSRIYLSNKYDDQTAQAFIDFLEKDFGISLSSNGFQSSNMNYDNIIAPLGVGAIKTAGA